jgi:hypothetical protein
MVTFGEVSWTDEEFSGGDKGRVNSKDLFLRLDEGINEVRLVTQPYQYLVHKYKKEDDVGFGQKVQCSMINGSCPLCASGDKAKPRWLLGVISRKTQSYKILDISYAVFGQIRKYAKNTKSFGDPTKYDLNIEVDKNGGATGYYSVQALGKEALSAADQDIKDRADLEDLKRRVTPPTAAQVQTRLDKINGVATTGATTARPAAGKAAPKAATPTVSMTDDETLDMSFPAHDAP